MRNSQSRAAQSKSTAHFKTDPERFALPPNQLTHAILRKAFLYFYMSRLPQK